jgi:hypothetical protein
MAEDSYDGTVTIAEGDNHYWRVEGDGTLEFKVKVTSGGSVDVLVTDGAPVGFVFYYEDHDYIAVTSVDEEFPMGSEGTVYLVVDNSNDIGVDTQGPVTVDVQWELTGQAVAFLLAVMLPIIFAVLIIVGVVLRFRRGRAAYVQTDTVVEDVYLDQRGAVVAVSSGPAAAAGPPSEPEWCAGCGAEKQWDQYQGRMLCPYCKT